MKIAFGNKARVGKDEACNYLKEKYGGTILRFADPLYEIAGAIQTILGKDVVKDPKLLQNVGECLRAVYGPDTFTSVMEKRVKETEGNIFIADLRYSNEADLLKKLGFTLVRINRPDRPIDRDPTHISEIALDKYQDFDETIENNSTIEEYHKDLDYLVKGL